MTPTDGSVASATHAVSVVIPVYQGETTLPGLLEELAALTTESVSPGGSTWRVEEVILVDDNGPDDSARVIRELAERYPFVRPVWLSRNYGQHSATLAGMASSGAEWIATVDEDGQHDPADIATLLDVAISERAALTYALPTNPPPHGALRNAASRGAKGLVSALTGNPTTSYYQSFRLMLGEVGRSVAAYAGSGVYLDVALGWVASSIARAPVALRQEGGRASGYSPRRLLGHFWRLILSSGTRGLRIVSVIGVLFALAGIAVAVVIVVQRLTNGALPAGWASLITVILLSSGAILFSLGVIAEYLGTAVNMAMGKPPYLIVTDPARGPLGRVPRP